MATAWNWSPIPPEWADMAARLQAAEASVAAMARRIDELQDQLDELKAKPPINVAYQFDQLKVNRLEGTLHVGISPQGVQGVESFETPAPGCWQVKQDAIDNPAEARTRGLQQQMATYMDDSAPGVLDGMAIELGVALAEEHRAEVLADVKRQVNERVRYYAAVTPYPDDGTDAERLEWSHAVIGKTSRDVAAAFRAYLSGLNAGMKPDARKG